MRGNTAKIGSTRIAPNGYHYTKVKEYEGNPNCWRLTHHIKMEEHLGRPLEPDERVYFNGDNKLDFSKENLSLRKVGQAGTRTKLARVEARLAELEAQRDALLDSLDTLLDSKEEEPPKVVVPRQILQKLVDPKMGRSKSVSKGAGQTHHKGASSRIRGLLIAQEYLCKLCPTHINNGSYFDGGDVLICGTCASKFLA